MVMTMPSILTVRSTDIELPVAHRHTASGAPPAQPRLSTRWARHADEVMAAQRLRHAVFAGEMGARLATPPGTPADLDVDRFDAFCEHLLVLAGAEDGTTQVVGTYRVLTPDGARRAGALYADAEFDLTPLDAVRHRLVELGRSCTDPAWRQGSVMLLLWRALADFMARNGLDTMLGCASVPMRDGGHGAANLWRELRGQSLAEQRWQVRPRLPLPVEELDDGGVAEVPALIRGYLRCGAQVLGAPAWDPDFGVADLPMWTDLQRLPASLRGRAA